MAIFQTKKKKSNKKKVKVPKTVQQSIPYLYAYEDNGIIEIKEGFYTKSYKLKDINYQVAKEHDQIEMFTKYGEFMNSFDSGVHIQININNKNMDKKAVHNNALCKLEGDTFDKLRKEYNHMLLEKMDEGRNNMVREIYLTLRIEAASIDEAELKFRNLDNLVTTNIKKIGGSVATSLSTIERLEILHDTYNVGEEGTFTTQKIKKCLGKETEIQSFSFKSMKKQGLTTKDLIGPSSLEFKSDYMKIGDKFARVLYLKDIATTLADNFLAELTNLNNTMLTSMYFEPVQSEAAVKLIRNQLVNYKSSLIQKQQKASKGGYDPSLVAPELTENIEEAEELLQSLSADNQKMYLMTFTIVHFADDLKTLNLETESIMADARRFVCEIKKLTWQQEIGFNTTLPLANNQTELKRTVNTNAVSVLTPFVSQELAQKEGFYYGLNAVSKNLILINRKKLKNPNGFIFGQSGGGKSFAAKVEMLNVLLNTKDDVIVIDPEAEVRQEVVLQIA